MKCDSYTIIVTVRSDPFCLLGASSLLRIRPVPNRDHDLGPPRERSRGGRELSCVADFQSFKSRVKSPERKEVAAANNPGTLRTPGGRFQT